jgi:hypothetical protein
MSENRELMRRYSDIIIEAEVTTKQQEVDRVNSAVRRAQNPVASSIGDTIGGALGDVVAGGRAAWDSGVNAFNKKVTPATDTGQNAQTPKLRPVPDYEPQGKLPAPATKPRLLPKPEPRDVIDTKEKQKPTQPTEFNKPEVDRISKPSMPDSMPDIGKSGMQRFDPKTNNPTFNPITGNVEKPAVDLGLTDEEKAKNWPRNPDGSIDLSVSDGPQPMDGVEIPMNRRGFIPDPEGTRESAGQVMRKLSNIVSEAKDPENVKKSSKDMMKPYK